LFGLGRQVREKKVGRQTRDLVVLLDVQVAFERVGGWCMTMVEVAEIRTVNRGAGKDASRNGDNKLLGYKRGVESGMYMGTTL
jgi:hypothetical protein